MFIKNLLRFSFIIMCMTMISSPTRASSIKLLGPAAIINPINEDSLRALQIEERVREIQAMDLQNLSPAERKSLRKELIQMKEDTGKHTNIYISVGGLIVIILLLILILR
jgi:hypothetical protein